MKKVTVLGSGSWGTALAQVFAKSGAAITLWCYESDVADEINTKRTNSKYMAGALLASNIHAVDILNQACDGADLIVEAVPMAHLESVLAELSKDFFSKDWVITSKGIVGTECKLASEILHSFGVDKKKQIVLVGPTFAHELIQNKSSGFLIAGLDVRLINSVASFIEQKNIIIQKSNDLIGAQIAGALKNCVALAVGILMGSGLGENGRALALVQGVHELLVYGAQRGAQRETLLGIAGLGDLLLTSCSTKSKNYRAGFLLGQGASMEEVKKHFTVLPEGFNTVQLLGQNNNFVKDKMPLCYAVYRVLREGEDPSIVSNVLRTSFE